MSDKGIEEAKKKKKPYDSLTVTTGCVGYNIAQFNKHMGTAFPGNDNANPSTEEAKAAAKAAEAASDALADGAATSAASQTTGSSQGEGTASGGDSASAEASAGGDAGASSGMGEALSGRLSEAKRETRRYYIRPQGIFCANKAEVIRGLISIGDENCSVYSLKGLGDNRDVHKLTNKDIIYYYDDGILYDKNHVKVMDYDLYIKHEEERKKFPGDINNVSGSAFIDEYDDRITDVTGPGIEESANTGAEQSKDLMEAAVNPFGLEFESYDACGEKVGKLDENLAEAKEETCCICGEPLEGQGNNPEPYRHEGRCCDACNIKFVLPARMEELDGEKQ